MNENIVNYYLNKPEPNRSCLLALQNFILKFDKNISESIKWNLPCFSYKNKMCCFLNIDKKTKAPYILFVEGNRMEHPELEQGDRKRMKILRINPHQDLPVTTLNLLFELVIAFYSGSNASSK